jgi:hypothetical protein
MSTPSDRPQPGPGDHERRTSARRACVLQVRYREKGGQWHPATAMDLSTRGCRLRVGEDLPRAAPVRVAFAGRAAGAAAVEVQGTVMWCRLEGLSYQAGIHFPEEHEELQALLG